MCQNDKLQIVLLVHYSFNIVWLLYTLKRLSIAFCVSGIFETNMMFSILHLIVSHLSICSFCYVLFYSLFACNIQSRVVKGLGLCQSGSTPGSAMLARLARRMRFEKNIAGILPSSQIYSQE